MERCQGTLTGLVHRAIHEAHRPGLPPLDVVTLGLMLCCALDAVHRSARYLHLDVKPSNILIKQTRGASQQGAGRCHDTFVVKLADLGFAAHLPASVTSSLLGSSQDSNAQAHGVARGTPGYAPREQLRGRAMRRSDVYSFGATLKFAAAGRHPFDAAGAMAISQRLHAGAAVHAGPTCCHATVHRGISAVRNSSLILAM